MVTVKGLFDDATWCMRDETHFVLWRLHELYFFALVLAIPGCIMTVAYGLIAREMCRCMKEREALSAHYSFPAATGKQNRRLR